MAIVILIVEVVVLPLDTNEVIAPIVGDAEAQVEVESEHAVVHIGLYIPVVKLRVIQIGHFDGLIRLTVGPSLRLLVPVSVVIDRFNR